MEGAAASNRGMPMPQNTGQRSEEAAGAIFQATENQGHRRPRPLLAVLSGQLPNTTTSTSPALINAWTGARLPKGAARSSQATAEVSRL